ncbi:hypothetical protein WDZ92_11605 [Nostoc sp. NIES-2111]
MTSIPLLFALYLQAGSDVKCTLKVLVNDYSGSPGNAEVSILDDEKKIVSSRRSVKGVAEFCDLIVKTAEFSVLVGWPGCGQVEVRRLENKWQTGGYTIPVFYRNCHNFAWSITLVCPVLLRFVDGEGLPIGGVKVKGFQAESDRNGFFKTSLPKKDPITVDVTREGYVDQSVGLKCSADSWVFEKTVTMIRSSDLK